MSDGRFSVHGKKSGVTYASGELERKLVIVGEGTGSDGMSAEQAQTIKLE